MIVAADKAEVLKRLWERTLVNERTDCWEWQGGSVGGGYGTISVHGKPRLIHRLSVVLHGKAQHIDGEWKTLHSCDTPPCWNPDHLTAGTAKANYDDMVRKARSKQDGRNLNRCFNVIQKATIAKLYYQLAWPISRIAKTYDSSSFLIDRAIQDHNRAELESRIAGQHSHWVSRPRGLRSELGCDQSGNLWWNSPG